MYPSTSRPAGALRVGVISDVHADLEALEQALSLLVEMGADKIVCLGDVVEKGPDGDAVVSLLSQWCVPVMRGNHEDNAVKHSTMPPSLRGGRSLSADTIDRIGRYPGSRLYCWERTFVLAAHGTPKDN
ncbi:MAG: putative phosphodiesterase, partial [Myxococcota bacterium]